MTKISIGAFIALICIGILYAFAGVTQVDPGEYAVLVKNFGSDRGMQKAGLDIGTHWVDPIQYDVITYDTKWHQEELHGVSSATADGQQVEVDLSLQIGLDPNGVAELHKEVGPNYYDRIVYPATRALVRNEIPLNQSADTYTNEGRERVQKAIQQGLEDRFSKLGIKTQVNLRDIRFTNADFIKTIEEKAQAEQKVEIATRNARAAQQDAIRVANIAEGEKQKAIKEAEADRERLRLKGEGTKLQREAEAAGNLALAKAEAAGIKLRVEAYGSQGAQALVAVEWARNLGPNVKLYGIPTGAPGTTSLIDLNSVIKSAMSGAGGK